MAMAVTAHEASRCSGVSSRLLGEEGGPSGCPLPLLLLLLLLPFLLPLPPPHQRRASPTPDRSPGRRGVRGDRASPSNALCVLTCLPGPGIQSAQWQSFGSQTSSLRRPCLVPGNPASPPTEACPQRANGKGFCSPVPPTTTAKHNRHIFNSILTARLFIPSSTTPEPISSTTSSMPPRPH
ncbi:uncharacterized protein K444DRAFT_177299 [Hyaloscypha bicolor E]|uniref:Ig-like domain-containing protein n=1 Tax=Hyaloscypha bicolor E TaxID=1095630 RepID=A0A2J6TQM3_9HELO|nr:uncharacterized protein K444DRAFT_177299 [Hyaloscypha bicolor E]PMD65321.1 hypothetical protein K444DRAFT_177299 [Hyaloscypha bicolor E]